MCLVLEQDSLAAQENVKKCYERNTPDISRILPGKEFTKNFNANDKSRIIEFF